MAIELSGGCRVSLLREGAAKEQGTLRDWQHAGRENGAAAISLRVLELAPGRSPRLGATACDEVCLPESGTLMLTGLRAEVTFYKNLFEKIGVQADMLAMGEAKTAAEPFTRTQLSDASRKQLKGVLDDHFDHDLVARIVQMRPAKKYPCGVVTRSWSSD